MQTDFDRWLAAQFAETGPFTIFIVLVRIAGVSVSAVKSSYAHVVGDDMNWPEMCALLDRARTPWDGVAFFIELGDAGGPLPDGLARGKLKEVEASVVADPLALNRGLFFDRLGRHLQINEVT